jgi:[acyl-carrier-protein] S-malonyltransferase
MELSPICMAGHSLGEYTALVAAGALQFNDGIQLVHQRAELMQSAVKISAYFIVNPLLLLALF